MARISIDHNLCIGCGACVNTCDNFKLIDGKSNPIKEEVSEIGCNQDAASGCPVGAITVKS